MPLLRRLCLHAWPIGPRNAFQEVVARMKSTIPWLRVIAEGVVIVGSILLAFGIDAWWEVRVQHEEETQLLADLAEEFASNRSRLELTTGRHRP